VAYDPCYHEACDDLSNPSALTLEESTAFLGDQLQLLAV
jgi:hypothetical protein